MFKSKTFYFKTNFLRDYTKAHVETVIQRLFLEDKGAVQVYFFVLFELN